MARHDPRSWVQDRRERTRHLIQLGGLVEKAGLDELTGHQSNMLLGALLDLAERIAHDNDGTLRNSFVQGGRAAFEANQTARPRGRERAATRTMP